MKDYSVSVTVTFSIQAANEKKAQERAQAVLETLEVKHKKVSWFDGDIDIQEPEVEEE